MENPQEVQQELEKKEDWRFDSLVLGVLCIIVGILGKSYGWKTIFPDPITIVIYIACFFLSLCIIWEQGEREKDYIQLFPTLGMFGTFLGVAIALIGFNPKDPRLEELITGLTTAVYTTVCGMGFYIVWNIAFILKDRGKEERSETVVLEEILKEIKEFSDNVTSKMTDNIEGLMLELNQTIANTLGLELKEFSRTAQNLLDWYKTGMAVYVKSIKEMETIYSKIGLTLIELSNRMNHVTDTLKTTLDNIAKSTEILSQQPAIFEKQSQITQEWAERIEHTNKSMVEMAVNIKQTLEKSQEAFKDTIEGASATAKDSIQSLTGEITRYCIDIQKVANNSFNEDNEKRKANSALWEKNIEELMKGFKENNEHYMRHTLEKFAEQMESLAQNYHKHLEYMLEKASDSHFKEQSQLQASIEEAGGFIQKTLMDLSSLIDAKLKQNNIPLEHSLTQSKAATAPKPRATKPKPIEAVESEEAPASKSEEKIPPSPYAEKKRSIWNIFGNNNKK